MQTSPSLPFNVVCSHGGKHKSFVFNSGLAIDGCTLAGPPSVTAHSTSVEVKHAWRNCSSSAEVGIDIPSSWVSKEWLEGRDSWIKKGGGEIEHYLTTSPFENYVLKRGCLKSNGQRSTLRDVGIFKAR